MKRFNILSLFAIVFASQEEKDLRSHLFQTYNKDIRPVIDPSQPLEVQMGLGVQNLEEFDQMEESIKLNIWMRSNWQDQYLSWNSSVSSITFLAIADEIWKHDVELLNAAGKPDLYLLNGGENLYSSGDIMWSKPAIFKLSCSLDLINFPFDSQTCKLIFGSWLYNNESLRLKPYDNVVSRVDILNDFSHSEWEFDNFYLEEKAVTRTCCPNEFFDTITYYFTFNRYTHYYKLSMGMTLSLVIASFIIMLMEPDNVSRTGTAVFIPLTILALQLTIADKIPVVGYYTLMDKFFLCCFISSMIVSIESGIIYATITTKNKLVFRLFSRIFDLEKLIETSAKKDQFIDIQNTTDETSTDSPTLEHTIDENTIKEENAEEEFNQAIKFVETTFKEDNTITQRNIKTEIITENSNSSLDSKSSKKSESSNNSNSSHKSNLSNKSMDSIISRDVIKVIDYNDKILKLTYNEKVLFDEIKKYIYIVDNTFRIILPLVFFIYVGTIYSHEN